MNLLIINLALILGWPYSERHEKSHALHSWVSDCFPPWTSLFGHIMQYVEHKSRGSLLRELKYIFVTATSPGKEDYNPAGYGIFLETNPAFSTLPLLVSHIWVYKQFDPGDPPLALLFMSTW